MAGWVRRSLAAVGVALAGLVVGLNACRGPLVVEPLRRNGAALPVDGDLELARRYGPFLYKAVHLEKGRQDLPARVDFDGDLDGENNWETFPHHELVPTVSYACVESATHWFLTYHVFHPRDWTHVDLGVHLTHEGDGENLQVAVRKSTGRVELLYTQAHYDGAVHPHPDVPVGAREIEPRGPLVLVDDEGRVDPGGTHAAVFVESGGHGIHAVGDPRADVEVAASGSFAFDGHGILFRPARVGEPVAEPPLDAEVVPYALASTLAGLWPALRDGTLVGEGRLLDGPVPYRDARLTIDVPRYHEADRFSGPFGPDRGISPFAVGFGFDDDLGRLFFDPARRYAEALVVPEPWALELEPYPFGD
ncbi:MAG: hypothetical protein ACF8XB_15925 [Planctomycetota bacterium JB042]